jgi:hypothetical protein
MKVYVSVSRTPYHSHSYMLTSTLIFVFDIFTFDHSYDYRADIQNTKIIGTRVEPEKTWSHTSVVLITPKYISDSRDNDVVISRTIVACSLSILSVVILRMEKIASRIHCQTF